MDDVWGNAWSQTEEDVAHAVPPKAKLGDVPPWSFPSAAADEEADVGTPSWSTGDVNWTEPTGQTSLWSNASVSEDLSIGTDGWTTNTILKHDFERVDEKQAVDELTAHTSQADNELEDSPSTEGQQSRSSTPDSVRTVTSAVNVNLSASSGETESLDPSSGFEVSEGSETFGSFEDGVESASPAFGESTTAWTSPAFNDANAEEKVWGSAWETPESSEDNDEAPTDEWTIAREAKERQDRSVPPELRAAIFECLNELVANLWPNENKPKFGQDLGNWRDGLSSVSGFEETVQECLPETQVQPPIRFSESRTARAMVQSLKLSKNLPIARNSPMSHLFTAKSLAAWEISVKSKVEIPKDDIPAGWKTVEPEEKRESKPLSVERKSGGILSFFGKRSSAVPSPTRVSSSMDSKRSSISQEIASDATSGSPAARNSSDANSLASKIQISSSVSSLSSIPPAPLRSPSVASFSTSPPPSSSPAPPASSLARSQAISAEEASAPAPSVVSRFLNRFSRTTSDMRSNSTSPRSSIALSTDDLEFLSDIVPSHSDDVDGVGQLDSLTAFVSSPAVLEKLPPPLAPPPLAPPPRPPSVNRSHLPQPRFQQSLPSAIAPKPDNSFGELESLKLGNRRSADIPKSNGSMFAALPPPLPPPMSPTSVGSSSRPPTPSPLSGGVVRTLPTRTLSSSTPPRVLSPPASISPPYHASQRQPGGTGAGSSSPLSAGVNSAGSLSVGGPVSTSPAQSNLQPGLPSTFIIPPPPIEKSPNRIFAQPTTSFDDDEFSDFQSHATPSMEGTSTNQTQLASSFDLNFDLFPSRPVSSRQVVPVQTDFLGDFGDFPSTSVSPPLAVPKEASPELFSSPAGIPPPLPKKQVPANLNTLHIRKPSASDHDATARLVERAAARQGRWPAPLSPLPEPLSPPPVGGTNSTIAPSKQSTLELSRNGVDPQPPFSTVRSIALKPIAQITPPVAAREQVVSPPPLLAPPKSSGSLPNSVIQASLLDLGETPHPSGPRSGIPQAQALLSPLSISNPPTSSAGSAKSNLSAQDLSFFEGL